MTKELYHYTSKIQAEMIMKAGYLELTPSDLIKPIDLKLVTNKDGVKSFVSELSDSVKPVVWLTDSTDPAGQGLEGAGLKELKKRIRITVAMKESYQWWIAWAERNRMNKKWFKDYVAGHRYGTWFVSEEIILLEDVLLIEDLVTGEILLDNRQENSVSRRIFQ